MHPTDELMVEKFLPSMRQLVARELSRQGYSQSRVAVVLGITQASVSHYLSSGPSKAYGTLEQFHLSKEMCDGYSKALADDAKRNASYGVETLRSIWLSVLGRGFACDAHVADYPSLSGCDVCVKAYGGRGEGGVEVLAEVARAVKLIESSETFAMAMPEVSVNLACVSGDSDRTEDVAAIPGRIVKVKGRATALRQPEFGASGHMAKMLLSVRGRRRDLRAVINLRFDAKMARALKRMGLRALELGEHAESRSGDPTADALVSALARGKAPFDAVVDSGGRGIEPNVYLFGKGAVEVASLAVKASDIYSAG